MSSNVKLEAGSPGKGVVAQIAERRLTDVRAEFGDATYSQLAARADVFSATPGGAPRQIVGRLAAPGLHLIAEVKRSSPSAGAIVADADPVVQARAYEAGGASAISVLCEPHWFGGSVADLRAVRSAVGLPVLAKEFVVDERQLPAVRTAGADVVLLLASVLPAADLARYVDLAVDLGLEPLVEGHDEAELEAALATSARLIGLNNRSLRTLEVDPDNCVRLRRLVPDDRLVVGESGVKEPRTLVGWRAVGIDAALVGETLMRSADPAAAARAMVSAGSMPRDIAAEDRRPLVKICGVTDVEGTLAAVRSGTDAIGLNFVPGSSRRLALEEGAVLARLVRESARPGSVPLVVAVVADMPASDLEDVIAAVAPDAVQLSGSEPVSAIAAVARPAWKVLHLPAADATRPSTADLAARTIARGREYLAAGAARLLLDTAGGPLPGGTGRQVARDVAAAVAREIPVILAGGLDVSNVAGALLEVPAVGVDVASGVEPPRNRGAGTGRAAEGTGHATAAGATPRATTGTTAGGASTDAATATAARPPKDPLKVALFVKRAIAARFDRPSAPARPTPVHDSLLDPDERGRWGLGREFGGRYVPETLIAALEELEAAWLATRHDPRFWAELRELRYHYGGRPTAIYRADRLGTEALEAARGLAAGSASELPDRIRLYLKREDLNHTGAHKLNNALGQVLLALRLGKRRIVAETGAGMHGVATATACALLEVPCVVHMGVEDIARQAPNVLRMEALGAEVRPVHGGSGTLKDAVSEALRDWVTTVETTHYCLGSTMGPHPYPMLVRDFQRVIGDEAAAQLLEVEGRLPDLAIACVGGGSNALGLLQRFIGEPSVRLAVAEAAGEGISTGRHAAALLGGTPGILHGSRSYMLQDPDGQVVEAVSISAGLDYPGIGPQLSALMEAGRLTVTAATDAQAVAAVRQVARTEGILAAVESAHAVAALPEVIARLAASGRAGATAGAPRPGATAGATPGAPGTAAAPAPARTPASGSPGAPSPLPRETVILLGLSGRGDKDLAALGLREGER